MAGDTVNTTVQYYYLSIASGTNSSFASTIIKNLLWLLNGSGNVSSLVKGNATAATTQLGSNTGFVNLIQSSTTFLPVKYFQVIKVYIEYTRFNSSLKNDQTVFHS